MLYHPMYENQLILVGLVGYKLFYSLERTISSLQKVVLPLREKKGSVDNVLLLFDCNSK